MSIEQAAVSSVAIAALTYLEVKAIEKGINGKRLSIIAAIIGGIAGYNAEGLLSLMG